MKFQSFLCLLISIVILSSCSSTQEAYLKNISIYLDVKDGIVLTDKEITASKADLIYITRGDRPPATMALAFIEAGNYKWVSRDNAVFVMHNGRLIRTSGLDRNLMYVTDLDTDPIKDGSKLVNGSIWSRFLDSENDHFGVKLKSQFQVNKDSNISIQNTSFQTVQITETVSFESSAHGNHEWVNKFWYDKTSGQLLKSIQKNTPDADIFNITYISRAVRLATQ